jgi:precorrin-2 dehydrogenase/sirohydrochlorin ferrochelatase
VCAPLSGLIPEVLYRITSGQVIHHDQWFTRALLTTIAPALVLTAIDDPVASSSIYKLCKYHRIPVNVADVPPECDFYFGSVHRDGPLQVMVSTNGNGPKLANIVRRQIASTLPPNLGAAIVKVGILRKKLRKVSPDTADGPTRMEWMSRVCEDWSLAELCEMTEEDMDSLLDGYKLGKVITLREIRGPPEDDDDVVSLVSNINDDGGGDDENGYDKDRLVFEEAFDCSFGWF